MKRDSPHKTIAANLGWRNLREGKMWIVKGILFGVVIFIVGGISYTLIRVSITRYRLEQAVKGATRYLEIAVNIRGLIHDPIIWAALFLSIAVGIWIVRARATHHPSRSVDRATEN